jgi:hypothetical protein
MKKIERKFTSNKHSEPPVGDPTCWACSITL